MGSLACVTIHRPRALRYGAGQSADRPSAGITPATSATRDLLRERCRRASLKLARCSTHGHDGRREPSLCILESGLSGRACGRTAIGSGRAVVIFPTLHCGIVLALKLHIFARKCVHVRLEGEEYASSELPYSSGPSRRTFARAVRCAESWLIEAHDRFWAGRRRSARSGGPPQTGTHLSYRRQSA